MKRRRFLSLLTISGVASILSGFVPWMSSTEYGTVLQRAKPGQNPASFEGSMFYDVKKIGESYLRRHPEEADQDYLANAVQRRCDQAEANEGRGLDPQIRVEFASDRTVRVDGWILARTEARLCALIFLS